MSDPDGRRGDKEEVEEVLWALDECGEWKWDSWDDSEVKWKRGERFWKKMNRGKSVGSDVMRREKFLKNLFNEIIVHDRMPEKWRRTSNIQEKWERYTIVRTNYKDIKLVSSTMKICGRVTDGRLRRIANIGFGWMPGRSPMDATFALRQLIERAEKGSKTWINALRVGGDAVTRNPKLWVAPHHCF